MSIKGEDREDVWVMVIILISLPGGVLYGDRSPSGMRQLYSDGCRYSSALPAVIYSTIWCSKLTQHWPNVCRCWADAGLTYCGTTAMNRSANLVVFLRAKLVAVSINSLLQQKCYSPRIIYRCKWQPNIYFFFILHTNNVDTPPFRVLQNILILFVDIFQTFSVLFYLRIYVRSIVFNC